MLDLQKATQAREEQIQAQLRKAERSMKMTMEERAELEWKYEIQAGRLAALQTTLSERERQYQDQTELLAEVQRKRYPKPNPEPISENTQGVFARTYQARTQMLTEVQLRRNRQQQRQMLERGISSIYSQGSGMTELKHGSSQHTQTPEQLAVAAAVQRVDVLLRQLAAAHQAVEEAEQRLEGGEN